MDEWYKAAYYNPTTSTYFDFPNGSNTAPTAVSSGTADGTASASNPPDKALQTSRRLAVSVRKALSGSVAMRLSGKRHHSP